MDYLANKGCANGKIGFGITAVDYDNVSSTRMESINCKLLKW
jgi:hypothetical protein